MKALFTRLLIGAAVLLLLPATAFAQDGTLSGIVTDGQTGDPLPGATVQINELGIGSATNVDGNFEFSVPAGEYEVTASFVGYNQSTQVLTIAAGETTTADFTLQPRTEELDEIVVTAQNIERQAKSLGYSVTELEPGDVADARETNIVNALQGKVPGLQIVNQSGDIGSSTSITLRGVASLSGDNEPLFVVDGQPIFNSNIVAGALASRRDIGVVDVGNLAADINPQNIESISILKGASAAARYGQRARNGAIIITTKRGSDSPTSSVTVSSSVQASRPLRLPDLQNQFAQGSQGKFDLEDLGGWGPEIKGQEVVNFRGEKERLRAHPDNIRDFYETGVSAQNSVSFSSSGDFGDFRLSVNDVRQGGIAPEADLSRTNISVNAGSQLSERVSARVTANYVTDESAGRARQGANDPNILLGSLYNLPRNISNAQIEDYQREDGSQVGLDFNTNNPYWIANENPVTTDRERIFGSGQINVQALDYLELSARVGTDYYVEDRRGITSKGTLGQNTGRFTDDNFQERQVDADFIANFDRNLNEDFNLKLLLGNNLNYRSYFRKSNTSADLSAEGLYVPTNATTNSPTSFFSEQSLVGVYGTATVGFRDYAFLELTGRNDWSSTLPVENRSFFYPSANLSFVFTDFLREEFDLSTDILSYGKLRANYAQVGSDTAPYQLNLLFFSRSQSFGQFGFPALFPFAGQSAFVPDTQFPNPDLEPEIQTSYEIGAELGFFNGRANLDITYYDQRTSDQIISLPASPSTGFNTTLENIGELQNTGIEIALDATLLNFSDLVFGQDFAWQTTINYSANDNKVVDLGPSIDEFNVQSGVSGIQFEAIEGESIKITGPTFPRDPETGQIIVNGTTGLIDAAGPAEPLADLFPDFQVGFGSSFALGPVSLGVLVDWQNGGALYSETVQSLRNRGLAEETAAYRNGTFIPEGVIVERNAEGEIIDRRPTDIAVTPQEFWQQYTANAYAEGGVFDASYVKLREVTLSFDAPSSLLRRTFLTGARVTFSGRNLLLLYSKIPHIDPETNSFGSGADVGQGYEFNTLPSTRTFGMSIDLSF